MIKKTLLKKLHLLALTVVMLVVSLGIMATPVSASEPPPAEITADMVVNFGTIGAYEDIHINGGPALPGWCVNEHVNIYVNTHYTAKIYDYFKRYYPNYLSLLPSNVASINWFAVAYIINNKVGNSTDVQAAIWYFTDHFGDTGYFNGLSANSKAMVNAAVAYLAAHGGIFVPGEGQMKPVICYVSGSQVIFFEYGVTGPPPPPLPELPSGALLGLGLVGLVGVGWFGYRKSHVMTES